MNDLLSYILKKLELAITQKGAYFKFGSLASSHNNIPEQRMVVIRKLIDNKLYIYTDSRSQKVNHYQNNDKASLLFYDTELMEQLILKGKVTVEITNTEQLWETIPDFTHKDYTTLEAPGTPIKNDIVEYDNNTHHFCYLIFEFNAIDYLKIDRTYNKRTTFSLNNNEWIETKVTP